jgi:hypothetical protein
MSHSAASYDPTGRPVIFNDPQTAGDGEVIIPQGTTGIVRELRERENAQGETEVHAVITLDLPGNPATDILLADLEEGTGLASFTE